MSYATKHVFDSMSVLCLQLGGVPWRGNIKSQFKRSSQKAGAQIMSYRGIFCYLLECFSFPAWLLLLIHTFNLRWCRLKAFLYIGCKSRHNEDPPLFFFTLNKSCIMPPQCVILDSMPAFVRSKIFRIAWRVTQQHRHLAWCLSYILGNDVAF